MNEWEVIKEKIELSTIKRYPWKLILGRSLTSYIHSLMLKGHDSYEIYMIIRMHPNLIDYTYEDKILKNLWISICARVGEKNSYDKLKEESRG